MAKLNLNDDFGKYKKSFGSEYTRYVEPEKGFLDSIVDNTKSVYESGSEAFWQGIDDPNLIQGGFKTVGGAIDVVASPLFGTVGAGVQAVAPKSALEMLSEGMGAAATGVQKGFGFFGIPMDKAASEYATDALITIATLGAGKALQSVRKAKAEAKGTMMEDVLQKKEDELIKQSTDEFNAKLKQEYDAQGIPLTTYHVDKVIDDMGTPKPDTDWTKIDDSVDLDTELEEILNKNSNGGADLKAKAKVEKSIEAEVDKGLKDPMNAGRTLSTIKKTYTEKLMDDYKVEVQVPKSESYLDSLKKSVKEYDEAINYKTRNILADSIEESLNYLNDKYKIVGKNLGDFIVRSTDELGKTIAKVDTTKLANIIKKADELKENGWTEFKMPKNKKQLFARDSRLVDAAFKSGEKLGRVAELEKAKSKLELKQSIIDEIDAMKVGNVNKLNEFDDYTILGSKAELLSSVKSLFAKDITPSQYYRGLANINRRIHKMNVKAIKDAIISTHKAIDKRTKAQGGSSRLYDKTLILNEAKKHFEKYKTTGDIEWLRNYLMKLKVMNKEFDAELKDIIAKNEKAILDEVKTTAEMGVKNVGKKLDGTDKSWVRKLVTGARLGISDSDRAILWIVRGNKNNPIYKAWNATKKAVAQYEVYAIEKRDKFYSLVKYLTEKERRAITLSYHALDEQFMDKVFDKDGNYLKGNVEGMPKTKEEFLELVEIGNDKKFDKLKEYYESVADDLWDKNNKNSLLIDRVPMAYRKKYVKWLTYGDQSAKWDDVFTNPTVNEGFKKQRNYDFGNKVELDFTKVFNDMLQKEGYAGFQKVNWTNWNNLIEGVKKSGILDEETKAIIKDIGGQISSNNRRNFNKYEKALMAAAHMFSTNMLWFNTSSMAQQISSVADIAAYLNPAEIGYGISKTKKFWDDVGNVSPHIKEAAGGDISYSKFMGDENWALGTYKKIQEAGLAPMMMIDSGIRRAAFLSAYAKKMKEFDPAFDFDNVKKLDFSDVDDKVMKQRASDAIEYADDVVQKAMSSRIWTNSPRVLNSFAGRLLFSLQSTFLNRFNIASMDAANTAGIKAQARILASFVAGSIMSRFIYAVHAFAKAQAIGALGGPKDDREAIEYFFGRKKHKPGQGAFEFDEITAKEVGKALIKTGLDNTILLANMSRAAEYGSSGMLTLDQANALYKSLANGLEKAGDLDAEGASMEALRIMSQFIGGMPLKVGIQIMKE